MENLFAAFVLLSGVGTLIAALINAGKRVGVVKDGTAPTWSLGLNAIAFIGFVALNIFAPQIDVAGLDANAQAIADVIVAVLGFVSQIGASKVANVALRGAPVVGFSHNAS